MEVRQNNNQYHKDFLKSSRQALLEIGMPLRTLERDAWTYLLEHGYCVHTNWTIDHLNFEQLSMLQKLVGLYNGNYSKVLANEIAGRLKNVSTHR